MSRKGFSKYHAKKVVVDGITFDSQKEAAHYKELKLLERAGKISNLQMQVPFVLIPAQYEEIKTVTKTGKEKIEKKLIERKTVYKADFVYTKDGETIIEDVKGYKNSTAYEVYKIKRKLMLYKYGIRIVEV